MMSKLDLRRKGRLSLEEAKKITDIEPMVRDSYNRYIGKLIQKNSLHSEQLLLSSTCRNNYASLIHDYFCRLALLEDQLNNGKIFDEILLDDYYSRDAVKQILEKYNCNITIRIDKNRISSALSLKLNFLYNILKNIYYCLNSWLWVKMVKIKKISSQPVILLDTFLIDNQDRYYTRLIDNAPVALRDSIYYLPTLFGLRYPWEWIFQYSEIAKSKDNILLKEHWLKWKDYKNAFFMSLTLPYSINIIPKWNNIDVSQIVRKEILMDWGSLSITNSLLIVRSFFRYKEAGIKVKGIVDWFENQVIDRALALGVRKYYPNVKIKGYMGYIGEEYYAGQIPTIYEQEEGILPDELLTIGSVYLEGKRKQCPWLQISIAPAFRFHDTILFNKKKTIYPRILFY